MIYIDVYQPPIYIQPEIFYEEPIYIQPIPAYPTVEIYQRIQTPTGTIIIDRRRERFFIEPDMNY